ncbi:UNVERIFIED_CONTAM: hypothetical protein Slati_2627500 [Sesamum latifolium]|uniref:Uncharacterized protein n=1 Tax=Sesamum latifolium TaxID=2727402 RepID=A0AAW2VY83_9LAMI
MPITSDKASSECVGRFKDSLGQWLNPTVSLFCSSHPSLPLSSSSSSPSNAGWLRMLFRSCVPLSAFVNGRWPSGVPSSISHMNSAGKTCNCTAQPRSSPASSSTRL